MIESSFVSIIIPCFNSGRYVKKAIQSALNQTHTNIEVIVIDDGSTDNSQEVIKLFGDLIRWDSGPNSGAAAARNKGVDISRGEFIQFLDADDVLLSKCVEKKIEASLNEKEIAVSDWETIGEDGVKKKHQPPVEKDPVLGQLAGQMSTPGPLHRKTLFRRIGGYDSTLPCCQERDLHLRMACEGIKFKRIPQVLHRVFRHSGSVSSDLARVLKMHEVIFAKAIALLEKKGELTTSRRTAFGRVYAREGRRLFRLGERKVAKRYFSHAHNLARGSVLEAYSNPVMRALVKVLGAVQAEEVLARIRQMYNKKIRKGLGCQ